MKKFPKVRPVGHPKTESLTDPGRIDVLEKMDGANFRFSKGGDRILFGSRNNVYKNEKDIANAFGHAVEFVREQVDVDDLRDDAVYFGEAMHSHTLEYDWENVPNFLGFAVYDAEAESFKAWPTAEHEFDRIGLPTVPVVEQLQAEELTAEYEIPESEYRDGLAEGVVFWHRNTTRAKLRSEEFREKHDGNTSGPEDHEPNEGHEILVETYCTDTRIDKRIDDLLDEGHDIGRELMGEGLPIAVARDILEEEAYEIVGMNETVDIKEYRSLVAQRCLDRIDERLRANVGAVEA